MKKIKNIIKILEFFEKEEEIIKNNLIDFLRQIEYSGEIVDWLYIYDYSMKLGLISERDDFTIITDKGSQILDRINEKENKKNIQNYIFLNCIYNNEKFSRTIELLKKFHPLNEKLVIFVEDIKNQNFFTEIETLRDELNVISFKDDHWYVNPEFQNIIQVNQNIQKRRIKTLAELDDILEEQKRIGNYAEELSLKYEKNEMKKKKWDEEMVERISIKNVSAGYDINSIRNKKSKIHDKFIEVKGRKYDENSFIISHNELVKARKEGEHYMIYFWKNLKSRKQPNEPTKIIKDPVNKLKIKECDNCLEYLIEIDV